MFGLFHIEDTQITQGLHPMSPKIEVPIGTPDAVPIEYTLEEIAEIGEPDENEVHLICPSSPYFEC